MVKSTAMGETIQVNVDYFQHMQYVTLLYLTVVTSRAFKEFGTTNEIKHVTIAYYHPNSNGLAERAVRTLKVYLRNSSTLPLPIRISKFLLTYRLTPHPVTGEAPSKLKFGRIISSSLDLVRPDLRNKVGNNQVK